MKEEAKRIQKDLEGKIVRLRQEVKGKQSVIEHLGRIQDDYDRLKAIEQKWLKQEREKEAHARQAEEAAKARQPQQDAGKAPRLHRRLSRASRRKKSGGICPSVDNGRAWVAGIAGIAGIAH